MDLIRSISWMSASHLRVIRDDDSYVDRLSHRYTVAICVLFCVIVSTKQYAGDPIDCWVPAQFKASYEKYADSYCWIAGSWYTPMDKELPLDDRERKQHRIRYYQWVPFLLLFQAILCYIPRIIWRSLNVRSGLDLVNLVDAAIKYESVDKFTDREKIMSYIVKNVERYIGARKSRYERLYGKQVSLDYEKKKLHESRKDEEKIKSGGSYSYSSGRLVNQRAKTCCHSFFKSLKCVLSTVCFWTGKRLGTYLVVLYMFVKSLWVTNAVSQLFLLNRFIGNDYHAFGFEIIEMLMSGQEWHEMRHFPRVTYCDFKIREIGNQHDWTVQCVLRINLFNEVIYIFMWFWLCILAVFSLIDFLTWMMRLIVPGDKLRFIKRHIDIYNTYVPNDERGSKTDKPDSNYNHSKRPRLDFEYVDIQKEKSLMREFTFKYLKDDGIFAMRILAASASDLITTEVISELWKNFRQSYDDADRISLSSSSTHTSNSSHNTSNLTASASSPTQSALNNKNNSNIMTTKISSPTSINKKPFNIVDSDHYSPQFQNSQNQFYQKQTNQQHQVPISHAVNFVSLPSGVESNEEASKSKQRSHTSQRQHFQEHSNVNPNSKDTHV